MYYALLRPHEEIRLLQRKHIGQSEIIVPGDIRKNGETFRVSVSEPLRQILSAHKIYDLPPEAYIIRTAEGAGPVAEGQTLYSVRHSAACALYDIHRDPYMIQRLYGHSDMKTTLIYLRYLSAPPPIQHT